MTISEKQELVRLLNLYQVDLLMDNDNNIREALSHSGKKWEGTYKTGVKAQYEHARVIAAKLSVEISKYIMTCREDKYEYGLQMWQQGVLH